MPINLTPLNSSSSYLQQVPPKLDRLPNKVGSRIVEFLEPGNAAAFRATNNRCLTYASSLYWADYFENKEQSLEFMEPRIQGRQPSWLLELQNCVKFRLASKGCRIQAIAELFQIQSTENSQESIVALLKKTRLFEDEAIESLRSLPEKQLRYFTLPRVIMPIVKGRQIDIKACAALLNKKREDRNREDLKLLLNPNNKSFKSLLPSDQLPYLNENKLLPEKKLRHLLTDGAIVIFLSVPEFDLRKFSRIPEIYFAEGISNLYLHALDRIQAEEKGAQDDARLIRESGFAFVADDDGYTALHLESKKETIDTDRLSHLLENGAEVSINDRVGKEGLTALHLVVRNKPTQWFKKGFVEGAVHRLVHAGAQYLPNFKGTPPLHYAIAERESYGLEALLWHFRQKVNSFDREGRTPLYIVALIRPSSFTELSIKQDLKELLIKRGATPLQPSQINDLKLSLQDIEAERNKILAFFEIFNRQLTGSKVSSLEELLKEMAFSDKYQAKLKKLLAEKKDLEEKTAIIVFQKLTLFSSVYKDKFERAQFSENEIIQLINELNRMSLKERRTAIAILGVLEWSGLFIKKQGDEIKFVESEGIKLTDLLRGMPLLEKRIAISNAVLYKIREQLSGKSTNKYYIDEEEIIENKKPLYTQKNLFQRLKLKEKAEKIDKATVENCAGHTVLAFWYLQELFSWKEDIYCVEFVHGNHVTLVWGQPYKIKQGLPQLFSAFEPTSVVLDGWTKMVCPSRNFSERWKVKMEKYKERGLYFGKNIISSAITKKSFPLDYESPTGENWFNLPDKFRKKIFAIDNIEYVSPIYQSAIKSGVDLKNIPNLGRF